MPEPQHPDKPIAEWPPEERARIAHSDDAPADDDPGRETESPTDERGFLPREGDLEGQDAGFERSRVANMVRQGAYAGKA